MIYSIYIFSITVYIITVMLLMLYGFHHYILLIIFYLKQKIAREKTNKRVKDYFNKIDDRDLPFVTVQLPVFNEKEVAARLISSAAELDYPKDLFEIQVVDDSTDETSSIIDKRIEDLKFDGVDVYAVRRPNREGYKAGGLANALKYARGEYAAIFDSDFIICKEFLKRSIAQIHSDKDIACLQGRWGHLNRYENWLTRAQSIGIDGHFTAEQGARSYNGLCMNFNGTAGVWRIKAIEEAGGWSGDTLTEDLDLSYRVQLIGYRMDYDFDLLCPAELPNDILALKNQQKRWAKGSMETAIKLMPEIIRSKTLSLKQKIESFFHLTHYMVAVLMVVLAIFTLPVLLLTPKLELGYMLPVVWTLIVLSALAPCTLYTGSGIMHKKGIFALLHFPLMLVVGMGLCFNNTLAVIEAFKGKKSEFVRTPKSGSSDKNRKKSNYKAHTKLIPAALELFLGVYCAYTLQFYLTANQYFFGFFIAAYAVGLITFGAITLYDLLKENPATSLKPLFSQVK